MKQYLAKQSADGMRLECIYPITELTCNDGWHDMKPQSFLTDDPTVIAGEKYEGEEWEIINQYLFKDIWYDEPDNEKHDTGRETRQILRRKAEGEKDRYDMQQPMQVTNGYFIRAEKMNDFIDYLFDVEKIGDYNEMWKRFELAERGN